MVRSSTMGSAQIKGSWHCDPNIATENLCCKTQLVRSKYNKFSMLILQNLKFFLASNTTTPVFDRNKFANIDQNHLLQCSTKVHTQYQYIHKTYTKTFL